MREDIKEWNDCRVAVSDDAVVHSELSTFLDLRPFVIKPGEIQTASATAEETSYDGNDQSFEVKDGESLMLCLSLSYITPDNAGATWKRKLARQLRWVPAK